MTSKRKGTECEGVACEHALGQQPLQLYEYLWAKASGRNGDCGKERFSFVLPDTVVFKRQKPVKWFFTSKQERGKILCKTKKFLSTERVLQDFLVPRRVSSTQSKQEEDSEILAVYAFLDRSPMSGEHRMIIEHLDKEGLELLLEEREKPAFSVLQRFVPIKSGYNHTVRSVYTAENCIMQKCISPYLLNDAKASTAQRTATFELTEPSLRHRDVTDREVQNTIEKINDEISSHLEAIVGKEMVRFVSFFKIGADNQVYLMWSSMISFDATGKATAKNYQLALEGHATGGTTTVKAATEGNETCHAAIHTLVGCNSQLKLCPNCKRTFPRDQVEYVVSHKSIIRHFDNYATKKPSDEHEDNIPPLLQAIRGPIRAERFKQLKQSAIYLYQTVRLCLICAHRFNSIPDPPSQPQHQIDAHGNFDPTDSKQETAVHPGQCVLAESASQREPAKEDALRQSQKPVVVQTRAASAGTMRMRFSKNNIQGGSHQYHRHLCRFLPRLHAFDPPDVSPRDALLQLALHLRRNCGHPSLRFALSQCNVFPVGSIVSLRALVGICTPELLVPVVRYWAALCQAQESLRTPKIVDIDALDGLLAGSINPPHPLARSIVQTRRHPRKQLGRSVHFGQAAEFSHPAIQRPSSAPVCVPKRPDRPRSCIATSASSRRSRLLALAGGNGKVQPSNNTEDQTPSPPNSRVVPEATMRTVDGVKCFVRASARAQGGCNSECVLHLEIARLSNPKSNQVTVAMELTLSPTEILILLGPTVHTQHLTNQDALLEGILPLVRIRDAQLCIPSLQQQQSRQALEQQQRPWRLQPRQPQRRCLLPPTSCPELSDMERLLLAETLAKE